MKQIFINGVDLEIKQLRDYNYSEKNHWGDWIQNRINENLSLQQLILKIDIEKKQLLLKQLQIAQQNLTQAKKNKDDKLCSNALENYRLIRNNLLD